MRVELGCRVRCAMTGFEGLAIGRKEWITACTQIAVQPIPEGKKKAKSDSPLAIWIDEPMLDVLGPPEAWLLRRVSGAAEQPEKPGGPREKVEREAVR